MHAPAEGICHPAGLLLHEHLLKARAAATRWYYGDPLQSVWHDPSLHTAVVHTIWLGVLTTLSTIPLGVAMALGLDRWRGRLPATANVVVLRSFVLPEILLAVALLFVVTVLQTPLHLGTSGQVAGLVTYQLSYPVVIVRSRLLTIGDQYEKAAVDLGASPSGAVPRVLLRMLLPAIFASTVLLFADVVDDCGLVRYLSGDASTEPVSVKIYNTARAAPTPALNALATVQLVTSLVAVFAGHRVYRNVTRGEKDAKRIDVFVGRPEHCPGHRGTTTIGRYGSPGFLHGDQPIGLVQAPSGTFYGVTNGKGSNGSGTVFRLTPGKSHGHPRVRVQRRFPTEGDAAAGAGWPTVRHWHHLSRWTAAERPRPPGRRLPPRGDRVGLRAAHAHRRRRRHSVRGGDVGRRRPRVT